MLKKIQVLAKHDCEFGLLAEKICSTIKRYNDKNDILIGGIKTVQVPQASILSFLSFLSLYRLIVDLVQV